MTVESMTNRFYKPPELKSNLSIQEREIISAHSAMIVSFLRSADRALRRSTMIPLSAEYRQEEIRNQTMHYGYRHAVRHNELFST